MVLLCPPELLLQNLVGTVCLITGGNSGLGLATLKQLSKQGATVVFTVRDLSVGAKIAEQINKKNEKGNKVEAMRMDLADLDSVRSFADEFKRKNSTLNILINNAGIMNIKPRALTKQGHEMQFGTNHLGHFLLTELLLDTLKSSKPSRIVCVSSFCHVVSVGRRAKIDFDDVNFDRRKYDGWESYGQSKLANVLHARELGKRLAGTGVTAVSLNPGWVRTNLMKNTLPIFVQNWIARPIMRYMGMIEPFEGIQTTLFCALDPSIESNTGKYYSQDGVYPRFPKNGWPMESQSDEVTDENAARLWELSERLVGK